MFGTKMPVTQPQVQIPTSTVVGVDTTGWQTYTNSQYEFEFKYPYEIKVAKNSTYSRNSIDTYLVSSINGFRQIVFLYKKPTDQSLLDWYRNNFPPSLTNIVSGPTEKKINSYEGFEVVTETMADENKSVFISNGNLIVQFSYDSTDFPLDNQKLIDSFKFINGKPQGKSCISRFSNCSCSYGCTEISIDPRDQLMDCQRYCSQGEINDYRPNCGYVGSTCTDLSK